VDDEGGASPFFKDLGNEPVAVNLLARNRDEQFTRSNRAGINRETRWLGFSQLVIERMARAGQPRDFA
jgi:hypothetical protein